MSGMFVRPVIVCLIMVMLRMTVHCALQDKDFLHRRNQIFHGQAHALAETLFFTMRTAMFILHVARSRVLVCSSCDFLIF